MKHLNIKIYGDVQGVSFRWFTKRKAEKLGVTGYVQNQPDGSVYLEAEGNESALEDFLHYCRKGPMFARVEKVEVSENEIKNFTEFKIDY